ncbi:MAG: phytanoyl-CoA dioxygenase family protein [Bacteroidetes bacterium]|nr:phytanoyl-CoA dioxygenase family protein [Bacteroidota bacterium]
MITTPEQKKQLEVEGYTLIKGLFSVTEIVQMRKALTAYFGNEENKFLYAYAGKTQSDAMNRIPALRFLLKHPKMNSVLKELIGDDLRFLHHSDAHFNVLSGWHKDSTGYIKNEWEVREGKEKIGVYKICFYLQDHNNDVGGLSVRPKSHLIPKMGSDAGVKLNSDAGDVIIFDQRLDHVGQIPTKLQKVIMRFMPSDKMKFSLIGFLRKITMTRDRMSVFIGYGNDNAFADEFKENLVARQNRQNNTTEYIVSEEVSQNLAEAGVRG